MSYLEGALAQFKICTLCNEEKATSEFGPQKNGKNGLHARCRNCVAALRRKAYEKEPSKVLAANARWDARNPEKKKAIRKRAVRKHRYGLTEDGYNTLFEQQRGRCAMCFEPRELVVDHNHTTGRVRALLCDPCNKAIGFSEERSAVLVLGALYLQHHNAIDGLKPGFDAFSV